MENHAICFFMLLFHTIPKILNNMIFWDCLGRCKIKKHMRIYFSCKLRYKKISFVATEIFTDNQNANMKTKLSFDIADLKLLATHSSFERGSDYYDQGRVKKVMNERNVYEGKVKGTSTYDVRLVADGHALDFTCNCTYEMGGICKHAVAMGLAILDGEYEFTPEEVSKLQEENRTTIAYSNTYLFEEVFYIAKDELKTQFLHQLLTQNEQLRNDFIQYVNRRAKEHR